MTESIDIVFRNSICAVCTVHEINSTRHDCKITRCTSYLSPNDVCCVYDDRAADRPLPSGLLYVFDGGRSRGCSEGEGGV